MKYKKAVYASAAIDTVGTYLTQKLSRAVYYLLGGKDVPQEEPQQLRRVA